MLYYRSLLICTNKEFMKKNYKSRCYINEQCMNHVIYGDDICLLAPSVIGTQQMLDVCFSFSICNDIIFKPVKSVCIAFQPKKSKFFCPNVTLDNNVLECIDQQSI